MQRSPVTLFVAALLLGLGGSVWVVRWLEGRPGQPPSREELRYLPSPSVARYLTLGYDHLAADLMWIRAVQYFGEHVFEVPRRLPRLRPLLELTVGLDPHFVEAYRYGALFLWVSGDRQAALDLLREGYFRNPGHWVLPHDIGRIYFLELEDYPQALRWWAITQSLPGAPTYIPRFIARLHADVGNLETALELWDAMERDPNTHEDIRSRARQEIHRLQSLREQRKTSE